MRLVELLIVCAIVAVLSAIAVPNFLEAQVRSKISRAKSDMRSLATGIESYYVDNNSYPTDLEILANGAVQYITSQFADPYSDYKGATFHFVRGQLAYEKAVRAGLAAPGGTQ